MTKRTARRPREQERSAEDNEKKANSCLSSGDESENEAQTRDGGKLGYWFRVTKTDLYTKASPPRGGHSVATVGRQRGGKKSKRLPSRRQKGENSGKRLQILRKAATMTME